MKMKCGIIITLQYLLRPTKRAISLALHFLGIVAW